MPHDLFFDGFFWACLFFIIPFFLFIFWSLLKKESLLDSFVLFEKGSPIPFWIKSALFCLAFLFAVFAMMQPLGNGRYLEGEERGNSPLLILLDASASMEVTDMSSGKSRFVAAKQIADDILQQNTAQASALWAFTSETTILSPVTLDTLFVRLKLQKARINQGDVAGTNLNEVLQRVKEEFTGKIPPLVVLLTDGQQTQTEAMTFSFPFKVIAIGMGTLEGGKIPGFDASSSLDEKLLKELAKTTRGRYIEGNNSSLAIAKQVEKILGKEVSSSLEKQEALTYTHYFQIPLFFSIVFFLLFLLVPNRGWGLFFLIPFTLNASSIDEYQAGNFDQAYQEEQETLKETDELWKKEILWYNMATILLQEGELDKAAELFSSHPSTYPWLQLRINQNLALVRFRQALASKDPLTRLYFLQSSQNTIKRGANTHASVAIENAIKQKIAKEILSSPDAFPTLYDYALFQNPLQFSTLEKLGVSEWVKKSKEALKKGKEKQAKLYLLLGKQKMEKGIPKKPDEILQTLIQLQKEALLMEQFGFESKPVQQDVLKIADTFIPAVEEEEKIHFKEACQKEPWNQVVPLFLEGKEATKENSDVFKEKAIAKWKEALAALKAPLKDVAMDEKKPKNSTVMQDLIEMSGEDQLEKGGVPIMVPGVSPW
jgi:Ca-activated chloride channel family protein